MKRWGKEAFNDVVQNHGVAQKPDMAQKHGVAQQHGVVLPTLAAGLGGHRV